MHEIKIKLDEEIGKEPFITVTGFAYLQKDVKKDIIKTLQKL